MQKEVKKRLLWTDLLRIFATLAVIGLHVCSGGYWYDTPVQTSEWLFTNTYGSLTKWCVPVFVMISGMLFLNPDRIVTSKSIFRKYLPRLIIAFIVWSAVYVAFTNRVRLMALDVDMELMKSMIMQFVSGHYHMWFLYMIAGLYLITPFLRQITANSSRRQIRYFLLLWAIVSILLPALNLFHVPGVSLLNIITEKTNLSFVTGFVGYYILGYHLSTMTITRKSTIALYAAGIAGAIFTVGLSNYLSLKSQVPDRTWHGNMAPGVVLMAIGIFAFFMITVSKIQWSERAGKVIVEIGNNCFGIYLVHALMLSLLGRVGINIRLCHPALSVPATVLCTFICSLLLTLAWRQGMRLMRGIRIKKPNKN